jgi:hypothetical protein
MSDELVTIEKNELVVDGGLGFEDTYIRPTNVILVQNTTKNLDAVRGKLFDELTSTNLDSIGVVPLKIFRGRALFPSGVFVTGQAPLCRSNDGVAPSKDVEFPQSDLCARCPKGSWDDYDRKTRKGAPTCKEKWRMLFIMKETGLPRWISIGGESLKPFRVVLEQLKQDAVMEKAKGGPSRNLFDYTFTITSAGVSNDRGMYYVAKFTDVKRLQDSSEYGPLYQQYVVSERARREASEEREQVVESVSGVVEGELEVSV